MSAEEQNSEPAVLSGSEQAASEGDNDSSGSDDQTSGFNLAGLENNRGDVKASTIARMMGLMTIGDLKLIESKVDLMATKVNNITVRLEKLTSAIGNVSQGSDFDRVEAQLASMRTLLKEFMGVNAENTSGSDAGKKRRERAIVSSDSDEVKDKAEVVLSEESSNGAAEEVEAPKAEEASPQEA